MLMYRWLAGMSDPWFGSMKSHVLGSAMVGVACCETEEYARYTGPALAWRLDPLNREMYWTLAPAFRYPLAATPPVVYAVNVKYCELFPVPVMLITAPLTVAAS
jgi:hypothetical protein